MRQAPRKAALLLVLVMASATVLGSGRPASAAATLQVTFLDVGQGDAALYRGPCGELGLVDANEGARDEVLAALDAAGTRALEWISPSHYDADHLGDVADVGTAPGVSVTTVFDRGGDRDAKDTQTYRRYHDWVTSEATRRASIDIGFTFSLCDGDERVSFTVVSAGTDGTAAGEEPVGEENDRGLCLLVRHAAFDLATCGDVNGVDDGSRSDVETEVAPAYGDVEFARVNHHGSRFASNQTYVSTLDAQASVVSVGGNSYGHPTSEALDRWDAVGDVYQTGNGDGSVHDGDVTVTTGGASSFTVAGAASGLGATYPMDGRAPGGQPADSPLPEPQPDPEPEPTPDPTYDLASTTMVLGEVQTRGTTGVADEFVELRNVSASPLDLSGWQVEQCDGATGSPRATLPNGTVVPAGGHYLLTNAGTPGRPTDGAYSGAVPGDQTYTAGLSDTAGVQLRDAAGALVDRVGLAAANDCTEAAPAPAKTGFPARNDPFAASRDAAGTDTGDNAADFTLQLATPTNLAGLGAPLALADPRQP